MNQKKLLIFFVVLAFSITLLVYLSYQPLVGIQLMQLYPWKVGVEGVLHRYGDGYVSSDGKWLAIQNNDKNIPQFTLYATTYPYEKINVTLPKPPNNYLYAISGWNANSWSPQGNRFFVAKIRWGPLIRMNGYCVVEVIGNKQIETNCYDLPEDYYGFTWSIKDDTGLIYRVLDQGTLQLEVVDNKGKIIRDVSINQLVHSAVKGKTQSMWALWDGSIVHYSQDYLIDSGQGGSSPTWYVEVFTIPIEHPKDSELIYNEQQDELNSRGVESRDPKSGNLLLLSYNNSSPSFLVMDPNTKMIIRRVKIISPEGEIDTFGMDSYCILDCSKTAWEISIQSGPSIKNYVMVWSWDNESYHFTRQMEIKGMINPFRGFLCSRDIYSPLLKNPLLVFSVCRE